MAIGCGDEGSRLDSFADHEIERASETGKDNEGEEDFQLSKLGSVEDGDM